MKKLKKGYLNKRRRKSYRKKKKKAPQLLWKAVSPTLSIYVYIPIKTAEVLKKGIDVPYTKSEELRDVKRK